MSNAELTRYKFKLILISYAELAHYKCIVILMSYAELKRYPLFIGHYTTHQSMSVK